MIQVLKRIWTFAGEEKSNIKKSIVLNFIFAIFNMFQIGAIYCVVVALTEHDMGNEAAIKALIFLVISIIGRAATKYFSQLQQTHAGYFMASNKRIVIGNKLKSVPMGYFNKNDLGEITGICTTILDDVETIAPMVLVGILSGFINTIVFAVMTLIWDVRIGVVVVIGVAIYIIITSKMQKKSEQFAPKRQDSKAKLVDAVLEHVQGMSVIKSFNLTGHGDKKTQKALEYNRKSNLDMEHLFTPYIIGQGMVLHLFSIGMILLGTVFYLNGSMIIADALMVVIMSFIIFSQIESAGSGLSIMRVVSSSMDQADETDFIPQMDSKGKELNPTCHDIEFKDVSFSYENKKIINNVNLKIGDKTTTAIIGPSGSGKTTLCNLLARFWDVDSGEILIGGYNVKDYTLESLMNQVSIVFQDVYLFADTIENNIKFGMPSATHAQVVEAAKKSCCHEFIETLPEGYETMIGEGGASLSGGEKQRISIARAMLKNAPIVIFDEATANVDPENEDKLQKAMESLMHDKTIIMIAHRLKTVRHADQIIVIDNGEIVQQGRHKELIQQKGIYSDFIIGRKEAIGWKYSA